MELKDSNFDVEKKDFLVKLGVLCEVLNCTPKTITNYIGKGLPFIEVGKQKAFYINEVKEWIDKEILKIEVVEPIEVENLESEFSFLGNREFKQFEKYYKELLSEHFNITVLHKHLVKDLAMLLIQKDKIYFTMLYESELEKIKGIENILNKLQKIKKEIAQYEKMLEIEAIDNNTFLKMCDDVLKNEHTIVKNVVIDVRIKMLDTKISELQSQIDDLKLQIKNKKSEDIKMSEKTIRELSLITVQIEKIVKILRTLEV